MWAKTQLVHFLPSDFENETMEIGTDKLRQQSVKTDARQPLDEYKHNQDITAPPEPIAAGTTSDVPIHGEKTNILFHPTPTITYKPMFEELEKRGAGLTAGIFIAVIVLGRMFGGSLWGLVPLAVCVASGVFLWTKEVVRSGKEMEWHSEQLRGETVSEQKFHLRTR